MKKHFLIRFISCLVYFLSWDISAKEFRLISLDDFGEIEQLKFQNQRGPQTLSIVKYFPNKSFAVPKGDVIHFYGVDPATGVSAKIPLLRISFEKQEGDTIVLLQKDENSPEQINYKFLKNDPDAFPLLSTNILNLSNKAVIAKLGDQLVKILPKDRKLVPLPKNKNGTFNEKVIFAAQKENASIDYFYSSFWRIIAGHKTLCIIEPDKEADTHRLVELLL
ncbi:MAG: hypothetical protein ACJZ9B_00635 [Coraliomargaritaceae bacterium]